jgi:hypothetical protein
LAEALDVRLILAHVIELVKSRLATGLNFTTSQTIRELSAIGAPTRSLWALPAAVYTLLVTAFGWGVKRRRKNIRQTRLQQDRCATFPLGSLAHSVLALTCDEHDWDVPRPRVAFQVLDELPTLWDENEISVAMTSAWAAGAYF